MIKIVIGDKDDEQVVRNMYPQHPSLMSGNGFLFCAKHEDCIIGFAWAFMRDIPAPIGKVKELFINLIAVNEGYRGQGIGSEIIQKCLKKAKEIRCFQVRAYCDIHNKSSHILWYKNKFGISPVKYVDGTICGSFVTYVLETE